MVLLCRHKAVTLSFLVMALMNVSCSNPPSRHSDDFILKSSNMMISKDGFLQELDLKKAAYPYNLKDDPEAYNQMVIDLVKTLTEEVILLSAAAGSGIVVTDREIDLAVAEFKKDYPEDSFEEILLENAISYPFWLHRFKKNMIIDRLIDQELRQKIEISSQDIIRFYNQIQADYTDEKPSMINKIENEKELIKKLRMQKTQKQYDGWIQSLAGQYPVQINEENIKEFLLESNTDKETANEK